MTYVTLFSSPDSRCEPRATFESGASASESFSPPPVASPIPNPNKMYTGLDGRDENVFVDYKSTGLDGRDDAPAGRGSSPSVKS